MLVTGLYVVEINFLGHRVGGAERLGAFKHKVLKVVGQASGLGWVVLRAGAHGYVGLYARLFLVDAEVDRQAVVESVDAGLGRIALHCLVFVLAAAGGENCHKGGANKHRHHSS